MKVLIASGTFPYPLIDGAKVRLFNLIKGLYNRGIEIYLVSFDYKLDKDDYLPVKKYCKGITFIKINTFSFMHKYINMLFSIYPWEMRRFYQKDILEAIKENILKFRPDNIYLHLPELAQYLPEISKYKKNDMDLRSLILDITDSLSLYYLNRYLSAKNIFNKIKYYYHYLKAMVYERKYYTEADKVIVVSQEDHLFTNKFISKSNLEIIANGVDAQYFAPIDSKESCPILVFTGNMDFMPNYTAALEFIEKYYLKLTKKIKNIKLYIVGRNPIDKLNKYANIYPQIEVTGYVPDIRPYLSRASVYISPIIMSGGVKNKILEAMAMGKPIVATPQSVGSMNLKDGNELLIAPLSDAFINKVEFLLMNPSERKRLSINARNRILQDYNWMIHSDKVLNLFKLDKR